MTAHYRTQAFMGDGSLMLYNGRSFELASQAWHQATWAQDKVVERRVVGEEWQVVISGSQLW